MTTVRRSVLIPLAALAALAVGACGGDEAAEGSATTTTLAPATTVPLVPTTNAPSGVVMPTATEPPTTPVTAPEGPIQIDVLVGTDSGPNRVEKVRVGSPVTLNITNPDAADEFHIHGIELEQAVDAGVMATFNFVADTPGTYEVESHETDGVLVVIVVE